MRFPFGSVLLRYFLTAGLFGLLTASLAFADTDHAALEAKKDQLFQQMMANPANLDVAFAYADVAGAARRQ